MSVFAKLPPSRGGSKDSSYPEQDQSQGSLGITSVANAREKDKDKKKLVAACLLCRKKKSKCSGERPACSTCLRLDVECEYPVGRYRASRFGYAQLLDRRMESLRAYCSEHVGPIDVIEVPVPSYPRQIQSRDGPVRTQSATGLSSRSPSTLPRLDILVHLADTYFQNIHNQTYSFLHKPTFMARLQKGEVPHALILAVCSLAARFSKHPDVVKNIYEPPHRTGEGYAAMARKLISPQFDEPSLETVQTLICLTQHDFFKPRGGKAMIYVSMAIPMALSLGLDKDLPESDPTTWLERECRRRTFWSLVVLDRLSHSSKQYSVQLTHITNVFLPCPYYNFVNNVPIRTPTLAERDNPDIAQTRGLFSYHVEATILWNRINHYACGAYLDETVPPWHPESQFSQLEQQINRFKDEMVPERFQYSRLHLNELALLNRSGNFIHLHAEIQAALFLLYKSMYPYDPRLSNLGKPPKQFVDTAAQKVREAANFMGEIVSDILQLEQTTVAPFVNFCVFTVSSAHVVLSLSSDPAIAALAKQNLTLTLRLLVTMRDYWYIAGVWCVQLKERYMRLERNSRQNSPTSTSANINGDNNDIPASIGDHNTDGNGMSRNSGFSRPGTPPTYLPEDLMLKEQELKQKLKNDTGADSSIEVNESPSLSSESTHDMRSVPPLKRAKTDLLSGYDMMTQSDDSEIERAQPVPYSSQHGYFGASSGLGDSNDRFASVFGDNILQDTGAEWLNSLEDAKDYVDFDSLYGFDSQRGLQMNVEKEATILRNLLDSVVGHMPMEEAL